MNEKAKEFRQKIAAIFIKSLEENKLDWKKGWNGIASLPINAITMKPYKGINRFWLAFMAMDRGYDDSRWATFKQIQDKGWKLQKGSKGLQVEYWMPYDEKLKKAISWDEYNLRENKDNFIMIAKYYIVFNAKNIDGIPEIEKNSEKNNINNTKQDELIIKLSENMNVEILNDGGDRAFYEPS